MEIGVHFDEDAVTPTTPPAELEVYMLNPVKIKAARREEVDEFAVYRKIPRPSALGGQLVTVKWIGVNRGDQKTPE